MAEGVAILDRKGTVLYANLRLATLVHESVENIVNTPFSRLVTAEDRKTAATIIESRSYGTIKLLAKTTSVPVTLTTETNCPPESGISCVFITPDQTEPDISGTGAAVLSRKLAIEKTNREITSLFTGIYQTDVSINHALEKLGAMTGADRSYFFTLSEDQVSMSNTHEWCEKGVTPQIDNLQHLTPDIVPWWMERLRNGETIHITDVSRLPPEASAEQQILAEQDIKSVLVIPVFAGDRLEGFIGLDNVRGIGSWSEDDVNLLASSAVIIGKALELRKITDEVAKLSSFQEKIIDDPHIWVAGSTIDGRVIIWNKGAENITGYTQSEVLGSNAVWSQITADPEKHHDITRNIKKHLAGKSGPVEFPFPIKTKHGEERYLTLSLRRLYDSAGNPYAIVGIGIDNTEQKLIEAEVQRGHRQLSNIIDFLPDGTSVIDREGKVIAWNRAMEKITGVPKEKIIGEGNYAYSVPFYGERRPALIDYVLTGTAANPEDYNDITKCGDMLSGELYLQTINMDAGGYFLVTASPLYDDEGNIAGAIESLRDVTALKATEEALKQSEEIFRTITTMALDAIIMADAKGEVVIWNKAAEKILGYTAKEAKGQNLHELIAPEEYREKYTRGIRHFIKTGTGPVVGKTIELAAKHKNGTIIPVELSLSAIRIRGEWQAVGIIRDITERKGAEEALRESERRLNIALDSAGLSEWDWNVATGELSIGMQQESTLDYNPESSQITIEDFFALIHPEDIEGLKKALAGHLASADPYHSEIVRAKCRDGTWKWIRFYGTVVERDSTGNPLRVIGLHQDVDLIVRSDKGLKEANKKLSLLSSITRHDILNQISVLLIYCELLKENLSNTDLEDAEYLHAMLKAAHTIERQITFTRDYEELGLAAPAWQNPSETTDQAIAQLHPEGIHVENQCQPDLEVLADPMFGKVIYNLLDNAIRHGETLTMISVSTETANNSCTIIIQDDGVGVPAEMKEKIFLRGVGSNTGYGLFLSEEILAITDITITENGIPGKGARFEIRMPAEGCRFRTVEHKD